LFDVSTPIARVRAAAGLRAALGFWVICAGVVWAVESRTALAHVVDQIRSLPVPSWPLIVAAVVATATSYGWSAAALCAAAGRRLPLRRTLLIQLASAAANKLTPGGVGGAAVSGRYLTTQGLSAGETGAAITLTAIAHVVVAIAGVLAFAPGVTRITWVRSLLASRGWGVAWVAIALPAIAVLVWLGARTLRRRSRGRVAVFVADGLAALAIAVRHPWRLTTLLATTSAVRVANLVALLCAMWAFDGDIPDWRVATVFLVGVPAAEAIPTPGGLGTVDAVLVAGLTGVGGTAATVVAAVVVFRLLTFWAPILPGVLASGLLHRRYALL
jgi:uncharacterized membrane protein YbhN (UPF0104 family)